MRLRQFLLGAVLGALPLGAHAQGTGTTIAGTVHDSLARAPLGGAMVQLVGADSTSRTARSVTADSLGRFRIDSVTDGRYRLAFFHPMLDSIGVEPPPRLVEVFGGRPVVADLAIPSPARVHAAICGARATIDSSAVLIGTVRDARTGAPLASASVRGEWAELSFTANGTVRRQPSLTANTGENGWFALCSVPRDGAMTVRAVRGADSTDAVELRIPDDGFLRRELHVGTARIVTTSVARAAGDTSAPAVRRTRVGDGRISGTVVAAAGGAPLSGAMIVIPGGPQARANEQGEWTLADAPAGTRLLEIRALGYYPERRAVDVVPGAPPMRVALATMRSVLDTVRITARRNPGREGFEQRRGTSSVGRFLTADDVMRRQPLVTTDLFKNLPGVSIDLDNETGDRRLRMRSPFTTEGCAPSLFLDGSLLGYLSADDIDLWVQPREIAGVEVYTESNAPPQFQEAIKGCGSIVIWTKR